MNHAELLTHLKVLAERTKSSTDPEIKMATVVLHSLVGAMLMKETALLAQKAFEFSTERIETHTKG